LREIFFAALIVFGIAVTFSALSKHAQHVLEIREYLQDAKF